MDNGSALTIILGKGKPKDSGETDTADAKKEAAGELISAIKSKDEEAFVSAFETLHTLCHESDEEGEEY